ncbi:transporter substrate-binding domain-containing protein [Microbulbifer guangxiensis]|uniref:transporter substrate-binding domain-containing protein n=1 Tax=Microbulbifer guangxiensis TaxID=2904249 RepID=UPI001F3479E7|nr:transporter substrate-binding domain-containing protein [Microbulbifer guangxiensis]
MGTVNPSRIASRPHQLFLTMLPALLVAALIACGEKETGEAGSARSLPRDDSPARDLAEIQESGVIRFVRFEEDTLGMLPRTEIVSQSNLQLARRLAERLGVKAHFLVAVTPQQAMEMVVSGKADVIADNFGATEERDELLGLTEPLQQTEEVLVTGKNGPDISNINALKDIEIAVLADSLPAERINRFARENPSANITVREMPTRKLWPALLNSLDDEEPIVTLMPRNWADTLASLRDNVKIGDSLGEPVAVVWAVRKDATQLKTRINNFLTRTLVTTTPVRDSDWNSIKKSGVLRLATHNGPGYLLWKGVHYGLDYELVSRFAKDNQLELEVIVVPEKMDLTELLESGQADIAAAVTTMTESRRKQGVKFTTPILATAQRVVSNRNSAPIERLRDLDGRTLTVQANSAFVDTAKKLRKQGIDVKVEVAPQDLSFGDILSGVSSGEFDATLEDSNLAGLQSALHPNLVAGAVVTEPLPQGWMVAQGNDSLLKRANQFLRSFLSIKENRAMVENYFRPNPRLLAKAQTRIQPGGPLSPYDDLVKRFALEHDLDWRLVVAQMWHESNFEPNAESHVGAQGLMQVMPRTAQEMGFKPPLFDPEDSLHAGTKYLNRVRERLDEDLPADEKLWFALAAYNAGIGHLQDARVLATKLGLDPDRWFDNVEVAMLKLSEPRYFEQARYGYARGEEPVLYVRRIRDLYRTYTQIRSGDISHTGGKPEGPAAFTARRLSAGIPASTDPGIQQKGLTISGEPPAPPAGAHSP